MPPFHALHAEGPVNTTWRPYGLVNPRMTHPAPYAIHFLSVVVVLLTLPTPQKVDMLLCNEHRNCYFSRTLSNQAQQYNYSKNNFQKYVYLNDMPKHEMI